MPTKRIWPRSGDIVTFSQQYSVRDGMLFSKWQDGQGTKNLAASVLIATEPHTIRKGGVTILRNFELIDLRYFMIRFVRVGIQKDLPVSIEELLLDPQSRIREGAKRLVKMWDKRELSSNTIANKQLPIEVL